MSGFINPNGPPGRIVDLLRAEILRLAVDDRILAEYIDVLRRPQLTGYFAISDIGHILRTCSKIKMDKLDPGFHRGDDFLRDHQAWYH